MKKIIGLIIYCNTSLFGFAQVTVDHKVIDRADGSLQYINTLTEIDGTPFLKDSWSKADALTSDGYRFAKLDVKYDIYNGKFIYNKNDTAYEFTSQISTINVFPNVFDTSNKQVFKKGFKINNIINEKRFVQVLAEGKASFLKTYKKEIEDYDVYGDAKKHQRFKEIDQYYILINGQFTLVKISKKDLETALASKATEIDAFMQKNNLSGKDEKSWVAAINYFNTL